MAFPKIGNLAPVFDLENQSGKRISLKDFRGSKNVVLYFYPKALTPGCTVQACGIRDSKKNFSEIQTVVFGISPDAPKKLVKFIEKEGLNFDLLSDEGHKVAESYGSWGRKKFMGREYDGVLRTTFIIDRDGRLQHIIEKVKTQTHHQDVLDWVKTHLL